MSTRVPHVDKTTNRLQESSVGPHAERADIGLIGVGLMGTALAKQLADGGMRVIGYDIDSSRCKNLASLNSLAAVSSTEVFTSCRRVMLSLPNSDVVRQVLDQVKKQLRPGQIIIDGTTGVPADVISIGKSMADQGVEFLDATIAGSSAEVGSAQSVVLAGGNEATFNACTDIFKLFSRKAFYLGPCGSGSIMKLVVNLVLGINRAALAEGLAFAKGVGLDPTVALGVLKESAAYSKVMDVKGGKMLTSEFSPQARLSQHLKDVRIILSEAQTAGMQLPLSTAHREMLQTVENAGLGQLDNSAIIRVFDLLCNGKEQA